MAAFFFHFIQVNLKPNYT